MSDKLTFNDVLDEMNADQEPSESIRFMEHLRDIYAPTIEMTQLQYNFFKWLQDTNNSLFEVFLTVSYSDNELSSFPELDLAQAWLHPETIKVVE